MPTEVVPSLPELERIAVLVARAAAAQVAASFGSAAAIATKSSETDVVTQTDLDTETLIRRLLEEATPGCGFVGEEGGGTGADRRLQWIIDPLDGTVNFLYAVPIFSVSIAAALDGEFVAGAVVDWFDVSRGEATGDIARTSLLLGGHVGKSDVVHLPGASTSVLRSLHDAYLETVLAAVPSAGLHLEPWRVVEAAARLAENTDRPALLQFLQTHGIIENSELGTVESRQG